MSIEAMRKSAAASSWQEEMGPAVWIALSPEEVALVLPGVDRHRTVKIVTALNEAYTLEHGAMVDSGVAAVELAPKGFDPNSLIHSARRCLEASGSALGSAKKLDLDDMIAIYRAANH